jgi:hypothetical protein
MLADTEKARPGPTIEMSTILVIGMLWVKVSYSELPLLSVSHLAFPE